MEKFSLDKYLENPSRKVVTRDGRPVRIVCPKSPYGTIVGFCGKDQFPDLWDLNGKFLKDRDSEFDLFFADEELTEFEKALLAAFNCVAGKAITTIGTASFQEEVDEWSKPLLDLAREELIRKIKEQ